MGFLEEVSRIRNSTHPPSGKCSNRRACSEIKTNFILVIEWGKISINLRKNNVKLYVCSYLYSILELLDNHNTKPLFLDIRGLLKRTLRVRNILTSFLWIQNHGGIEGVTNMPTSQFKVCCLSQSYLKFSHISQNLIGIDSIAQAKKFCEALGNFFNFL